MVSLGGRADAPVSMELDGHPCSGQEAASLTKTPFVASMKECLRVFKRSCENIFSEAPH